MIEKLNDSEPNGATDLHELTVNQLIAKEIREIKSKINEVIDTLEANGIYD